MRAEWNIAKFLRSGRLELLLEDHALPPSDIYAIHPTRHKLLAKVGEFIDFLIRRFAKVGEQAASTW